MLWPSDCSDRLAHGLRNLQPTFGTGRAAAIADPEHGPHSTPWRRTIPRGRSGRDSRTGRLRHRVMIAQNALANLVDSDRLVYVAGSSGAPSAFVSALLTEPERTRGARVLTTYVPGINALDMSQFHPSAQVTGLLIQPSFSTAHRDRRFRALPMSY